MKPLTILNNTNLWECLGFFSIFWVKCSFFNDSALKLDTSHGRCKQQLKNLQKVCVRSKNAVTFLLKSRQKNRPKNDKFWKRTDKALINKMAFVQLYINMYSFWEAASLANLGRARWHCTKIAGNLQNKAFSNFQAETVTLELQYPFPNQENISSALYLSKSHWFKPLLFAEIRTCVFRYWSWLVIRQSFLQNSAILPMSIWRVILNNKCLVKISMH